MKHLGLLALFFWMNPLLASSISLKNLDLQHTSAVLSEHRFPSNCSLKISDNKLELVTNGAKRTLNVGQEDVLEQDPLPLDDGYLRGFSKGLKANRNIFVVDQSNKSKVKHVAIYFSEETKTVVAIDYFEANGRFSSPIAGSWLRCGVQRYK